MGTANEDEMAVLELMKSVQERYFPELVGVTFNVCQDGSIDGVHGRAVFGHMMEVVLYYSDARILQPCYRMGLVPIVAHELAHYVDPVDPERILEERLPSEMVRLWKELVDAGLASCSMGIGDG